MDATVLVLVLAAAVVAAGLAVAAIVALLRLRPTASEGAADEETPLAVPLAEPDGQMRRAVERAQQEAVRARKLAALFGTLDLDELLLRVLETAVGLCDADAAAIALEQETGPSLETRFGLAADEAAPSLDALHGETRARSVTLEYHYGADEKRQEEPLRRGVVVPIPASGDQPALGALAIYWRRDVADLAEDELASLEELARSAAQAIENARRYKAVHDLAELDALSGLYNRRYFQDTLAREVKRAQRYHRRLALLVFDVDGLKAINDEHGHLAGDALLVETAKRLRSVTRGADVACRISGDEFAVILPESGVADAQQLHERLSRVLEAEPAGPLKKIQISAGIAQLRSDERAVEFFDRADQAALRAKRAGRGRLELADEPDVDEASAD